MSPRYLKIHTINKSTPSDKWLKLVVKSSQAQASLMFQLRSGHIGLNKHLHHIKCANRPDCPSCNDGSVETIQHYLFECHHYHQEQHLIQRSLCHNASNKAYLLANPDASLLLLKYVHTTRWLNQTFTMAAKPHCPATTPQHLIPC